MNNFTVPDICDENDDIQIGDIFLNCYGGKNKFYGEVRTAKCEHSNIIIKELVQEDGEGKVLFVNHTGTDLCSMVGDQIAQTAFKNNWNGIIVNGFIRDIEVIQHIDIGIYALNSYPKKTDKSKGIGEKDIQIQIGCVYINSGDWVYIDTNGWAISKKELKL
jgi:regulator of ribonuclease activity A